MNNIWEFGKLCGDAESKWSSYGSIVVWTNLSFISCNYDECEQCYLRTKQGSSKLGENDETDKKAASKQNVNWTCKTCTFENEGNLAECDCCYAKREMSTQDPTKPNLTCSICCDAPCEVAFVECGHCVTCERCANSLFAAHYRCCPICRKPLKSRPLRIYFA